MGLRQFRYPVQGVPHAGMPRDPYEKIADAAQVNAMTGLAPRCRSTSRGTRWMTIRRVSRHAKELGVAIGPMNSNLFQDDDYCLGSLTNKDPKIRAKAIAHHLECLDDDAGDRVTGPEALVRRTAPTMRARTSCGARQDRLAESLARDLCSDWTTTNGCCWSTRSSSRTSTPWISRTGERPCCIAWRWATGRKSSLDTGHHAQSTNIEFIVMQLLRQGRLGAFDFNSRYNADDDLIVGSADPFQLFRHHASRSSRPTAHLPGLGVNFMLDQCHNIEQKIPGQIRSVMNVQAATAKALLIDREALLAAQQAGDILGAHGSADGCLRDRCARHAGRPAGEPGTAEGSAEGFRRSGYAAKVAADRVGGTQAGWGA